MEFKKGDKVILKGFTGIKLGVFEIAKADKKSVTILKKNGDELVFSTKTGKQINVAEGKEKYANSIMEDDGSYVAPQIGKVEKKPAKKVSKKATKKAKVEEPEVEGEDEDEEEPEPKKTSKKAAKKPAKKVLEEDEDEDEDDYEEVDD